MRNDSVSDDHSTHRTCPACRETKPLSAFCSPGAAKCQRCYTREYEKRRVRPAGYAAEARARTAAWIAANKERHKAAMAKFYAENPTAKRVIGQNRRARMVQAGGKLSKGIFEKLLKLQRGKCACCGLPLGEDPHIDHIMPIALGGTNTDDNVQLLRKACNVAKHAKHPVDFMQEKGFLL